MTDWFEPGYKGGGPVRAVANMAQQLKNDLDIFIFTSDRDLGDESAYAGIETDAWVKYEQGIMVHYASPAGRSFSSVVKNINAVTPDVIFLNSMFSIPFSFYPVLGKRLGKIKADVILSPRGMLKQTALQFKRTKKNAFLAVFKLLGLHKKLRFHGTDATELSDIKSTFGEVQADLIPDSLPASLKPLHLPASKTPGQVKLIFVGRLHPVKNMEALLEMLSNVKCNAALKIIASIEDEAYWQKCNQLISALPTNITVQMLGPVAHNKIEEHLVAAHVFVLPTKGENFGHAIFEALAAGRPVLISDQTPWKDLANHKAGWDIPLAQANDFVKVIETVAAMNAPEFEEWCKGAWEFCNQFIEKSHLKDQYLKLFS